MNFLQVVIEAFRSMSANRLRTALTMLGIIIGITSVVLLLALGDSMQRFIGKELEALGTNMLYVFPGGSRSIERRMRANAAPALTLADAMALNALPSLTGSAPALQGSFKLAAGNETSTQMVFGVTPEMFKVRNWKLELGSGFSEADVRAVVAHGGDRPEGGRPVLLQVRPAGQDAPHRKRRLPGGRRAARRRQADRRRQPGRHGHRADHARRARTWCATRSRTTCTTSRRRASRAMNLLDAIEDIKDVLRDRHRIKVDAPDDFRVENVASFAETANKISAGIALLLGMIGAISLVVGGIGIMNIMLVSVTERTREIGIRMAIGAKPRDVLLQFLTEAVVICLAGGVVGIAIAAGAAAGDHLDRQVRRLHHAVRDPDRLRLFQPGRRVLRILSGPPRVQTAAGRLPAL